MKGRYQLYNIAVYDQFQHLHAMKTKTAGDRKYEQMSSVAGSVVQADQYMMFLQAPGTLLLRLVAKMSYFKSCGKICLKIDTSEALYLHSKYLKIDLKRRTKWYFSFTKNVLKYLMEE